MTKEEWNKVERSMSSVYGRITLLCDGYRLTLETGLCKRKLVTTIYVNGEWKGAWLLNDCEERRRFFRPVKSLVWKPKILKGVSKRTMKAMGIDPKETNTFYDSFWPSFRPLKAHLIKNNTSIELAQESLT